MSTSRFAGRPTRRAFLAFGAGSAAALLLKRDGAAPAPAGPNPRALAQLEHASQTTLLCSSVNAAGVGLRGEYFADERCRGTPMLVRLDESIDFDDTLDWPEARGAAPRSVRWSGWVKPSISGRYRFHVGTGDAHIVVARQALAGEDAPAQAGIDLAAGRFYPISVSLNRIEPAVRRIRLEWTAPHGARFLVPRALLYLPMEGLAPAPTRT